MNKPLIRKSNLPVFLFYFALVVIIIIDACRKIDVNHEKKPVINYAAKFFEIPPNTNPTIRRLAEAMKAYNDEHDYVSNFAKTRGFPKWDKCPRLLTDHKSTHRGYEGGYTDTIAFVPITNSFSGPGTAERVVSFLAARLTADSIEIRLFNTDEYAGYGFTDRTDTLSSETIALMSMYLERIAVADRDTFRITDDRLLASFGGSDSIRLLFMDTSTTGGNHDKGNLIVPIETTECVTFCGHFGLKAFKNQTVEEGCATITVCYDGWAYLIEDDPGLILTGGSPGGGGNGGGTGSLNAQVSCSLYPQGVCGQPRYLAWVPIGYSMDENYYAWGYHHFETWDVDASDYGKIQNWSQNNIDTVGLDSCVRRILEKLLTNGDCYIGKILAKMERANTFKNNIEKFQIILKVDSLPPDVGGRTRGAIYNSTTGVYRDTIIISRDYLSVATEMAIGKTLIHEFMHAYLRSIFVRAGYLTSLQLQSIPHDSLFNSYVDTLIAVHKRKGLRSWYSENPQWDHNFMADKLLERMATALAFVDNYRNSDEYYWDMTWGGLWRSNTALYYWPNNDSIVDWPPLNPAPSDDSTKGLKYAFTQARLDSIRKYLSREQFGQPGAKGRPKIPGACY